MPDLDDKVDEVTFRDHLELLNKFLTADRRCNASDKRKFRLQEYCRFNLKGSCTIDNDEKCRARCTDVDKKIFFPDDPVLAYIGNRFK